MPHKEMVNIMEYTIREIKDGVAVVDYTDGSWAQIPMTATMTEDEFKDTVRAFGPKEAAAPEWVTTGTFRAAPPVEAPAAPIVEEEETVVPDWYISRQEAYGSPASQIEFITEHGIDAWRTHVEAVKALFPKEGE